MTRWLRRLAASWRFYSHLRRCGWAPHSALRLVAMTWGAARRLMVRLERKRGTR